MLTNFQSCEGWKERRIHPLPFIQRFSFRNRFARKVESSMCLKVTRLVLLLLKQTFYFNFQRQIFISGEKMMSFRHGYSIFQQKLCTFSLAKMKKSFLSMALIWFKMLVTEALRKSWCLIIIQSGWTQTLSCTIIKRVDHFDYKCHSEEDTGGSPRLNIVKMFRSVS